MVADELHNLYTGIQLTIDLAWSDLTYLLLCSWGKIPYIWGSDQYPITVSVVDKCPSVEPPAIVKCNLNHAD